MNSLFPVASNLAASSWDVLTAAGDGERPQNLRSIELIGAALVLAAHGIDLLRRGIEGQPVSLGAVFGRGEQRCEEIRPGGVLVQTSQNQA